jgi:hypothetical protein
MAGEQRVPWRFDNPLPQVNGSVEPLLRTVDSLRSAWADAMSTESD